MIARKCLISVAFAVAMVASPTAFSAVERPDVDLALVLAVDVSRSMDPEEQDLQRQGFVEALRSPLVHAAIRAGAIGRIVVTYIEWSGESEQTVVVPWTVIDDPGSASRFADRLAGGLPARMRRTSISGAIDFGLRLLGEVEFEPIRKVIDISGDGPNSSGRAVTFARDEAVAQNVTINGLPIMLKRPSGFGDMENLDLYYRDCVIGGHGAFLVPVRERAQFPDAIRTKIVREIAGWPAAPLIQHAQSQNSVSCETRGNASWDPWRN